MEYYQKELKRLRKRETELVQQVDDLKAKMHIDEGMAEENFGEIKAKLSKYKAKALKLHSRYERLKVLRPKIEELKKALKIERNRSAALDQKLREADKTERQLTNKIIDFVTREQKLLDENEGLVRRLKKLRPSYMKNRSPSSKIKVIRVSNRSINTGNTPTDRVMSRKQSPNLYQMPVKSKRNFGNRNKIRNFNLNSSQVSTNTNESSRRLKLTRSRTMQEAGKDLHLSEMQAMNSRNNAGYNQVLGKYMAKTYKHRRRVKLHGSRTNGQVGNLNASLKKGARFEPKAKPKPVHKKTQSGFSLSSIFNL